MKDWDNREGKRDIDVRIEFVLIAAPIFLASLIAVYLGVQAIRGEEAEPTTIAVTR